MSNNMEAFLKYVALPKEITQFELNYLKRINKIALVFFYCHIPVFMLVAWAADTNPMLALILGVATLIGPTLAYFSIKKVRVVSMIYGFTAMIMGGLLVHFGQGPVQIEMHFYFFALLAMLCMFANPAVNLVAAVTVAVHHLAVWMIIPSSVFNYEAPFWVVAVHAAFVVLETIAACFISRQFFDNVIGLEKIVQARTAELKSKQRDMRLILDNVHQGFITIDISGNMSPEVSAVVTDWFGPSKTDNNLIEYVKSVDPVFSEWLELGLESLRDDFLPLEVTMEQLPKRIHSTDRTVEASYKVINYNGTSVSDDLKVLVVLNDITEKLESERAEAEKQQLISIFERILSDKINFLEFFNEIEENFETIKNRKFANIEHLKRIVHTIKGNSGLFGISTLSKACHTVESLMDQESRFPNDHEMAVLVDEWHKVHANVQNLMGDTTKKVIEITPDEHEEVLQIIAQKDGQKKSIDLINSWKLEPLSNRLSFIKDQTDDLTKRIGRTNVVVDYQCENIRIDNEHWKSFFGNLCHLLRNAIDHGIEDEAVRMAVKKEKTGRIELHGYTLDNQFILSIKDDGRGINWDKLERRAKERGVTYEDKQDLLFIEGLSTMDEVSMISGRGIGMSAVKKSCEILNGKIEIISKPNVGTEFLFSFEIDEAIYVSDDRYLRAS